MKYRDCKIAFIKGGPVEVYDLWEEHPWGLMDQEAPTMITAGRRRAKWRT